MSEHSFYKEIISCAVAKRYSFAMCRLPGKKTVHTYISTSIPALEKVQSAGPSCFVFSPFDASDHAFVLKPSWYYEDERLILGNEPFIKDQATDTLFYPAKNQNHYASHDEYIHLVNDCVNVIRSHAFKKLVAARCELRQLSADFNLIDYFFNVCAAYPNAYIYVYSSPETGTWMGATPEKLLTIENDILQTVALAGTLSSSVMEDWSQKEQEEHLHVEDFIRDVFAIADIHHYEKGPVETIEAGNVRHLRSIFSWQQGDDILHQHFSSILSALNPTPAVCGLPKQASAEFLKKHEHFERRFYSGFTGVITEQSTHLFVNLRCIELFQQEVILYAGAGITGDSIAEKEWLETARKMQTMGSLL